MWFGTEGPGEGAGRGLGGLGTEAENLTGLRVPPSDTDTVGNTSEQLIGWGGGQG